MIQKQKNSLLETPNTDTSGHQDDQIPVLEDRFLEPQADNTPKNAPKNVAEHAAEPVAASQDNKGGNPFLPYDRLAELARERQTFNAELAKLLDRQHDQSAGTNLSGHQLDMIADKLLHRMRPRLESLIRQIIDEQTQASTTIGERKR